MKRGEHILEITNSEGCMALGFVRSGEDGTVIMAKDGVCAAMAGFYWPQEWQEEMKVGDRFVVFLTPADYSLHCAFFDPAFLAHVVRRIERHIPSHTVEGDNCPK